MLVKGATEGMIMLIGSVTTYSLVLTHWGRVTHIYVNNLTITGSDNGLSPGPVS